jgi:ribosomal protein S18 acetylase RimI-like enzyme
MLLKQVKLTVHNISELSDDILAFLQISTHWSSDRTSDEMYYAITNSLSAIVTYNGFRIVGFGRIIGDGYHLAVLTDIACHPECQGQKIATNIVKQLCADVPNCRSIRAMTSQANGLYKKLGFVEYGGDTMELTR